MGHSISETLNKWDTSLSWILLLVPNPNMNVTKWDTVLFEASLADVFVAFQGKVGFFFKEVGDKKDLELDDEEESEKECEEEEK